MSRNHTNGSIKPTKFTYDEFFELILRLNPSKGHKMIKEVVDWNLNSPGENMLMSLLKINMEPIVISKCKNYYFDIVDELFYFCLENGNEDFLKQGMLSGIFNHLNLFDRDYTLDMYLKFMERGVNLDTTLNLLIYSNISKMKLKFVHRLLNVINRIVAEPNEHNIILHTTNTLMCLALCQEILRKIAKNVSLFSRKCTWISQRLETLIEKIIFNFDYDLIESIFLSRDYKNRSLIKIVTLYQLKSFLKSTKTTILLDTLWQGLYTTECDGRLADFSTMNYLLNSKTMKVEGRKISPKDLLTNQFTINISRVKFWFQYVFRNESIDYIFKKDFLSATFIVIVFQYINFQYLELFRERVYRDLPSEQAKINKINRNLEIYANYNIFGTICAFSLLYSGACKWSFNKLSKNINLPMDKWTVLDVV